MNWLEYMNGSGDTHYANMRRENGHAEPYNVKYIGLGSECHRQAGSLPNDTDVLPLQTRCGVRNIVHGSRNIFGPDTEKVQS